MKSLYCVECGEYLMAGSGSLIDCSCGWKQPEDKGIDVAEYEALQAECEKLRKDAERYRWLRDQEARDNAICVLDCGEWVKPAMVIALAYSSAEQCDSAIDTAIQEDSPCHT